MHMCTYTVQVHKYKSCNNKSYKYHTREYTARSNGNLLGTIEYRVEGNFLGFEVPAEVPRCRVPERASAELALPSPVRWL